MSFLKGGKLDIASSEHCLQVGDQLAKMHYSLKDFTMNRSHSLNHTQWRNIFN